MTNIYQNTWCHFDHNRLHRRTDGARVDAEMQAIVNERGISAVRHDGVSPGLERRTQVRTMLCLGDKSVCTACLLCWHAQQWAAISRPAYLPPPPLNLWTSSRRFTTMCRKGTPQRNERDAVWWGMGDRLRAINAGDGMHALGRLALLRLADRGVPDERVFDVVRLVDKASLRACEGRFRDLEAQERIDLSVEAYTRMAADKAGALLGVRDADWVHWWAARDAATRNALAACGEKLGIALQVRSDLEALWGKDGQSQPNVEVLNKKKLIPVVYALENATISEKRAMGEIYFKRVLEPDDARKLREVIDGMGARAACEEMADTLKTEALACLQTEGIASAGGSRIREYIEMLTGGR